MYKKMVNILKMIISIYFVYIGVELTRIVMEQRPSDLTLKLVIAAVFMLSGTGYFLWTLNYMSTNIREKIKKGWERYRQKTAQRAQSAPGHMTEKYKPQRDRALFRTAPMSAESEIIKGTVRMRDEEPEEIPEELTETEHKMPDSWDEATRAMWMEEENENDSLKRYWHAEEGADETVELPGISGQTQELPVIPEDTQEILSSLDSATKMLPDISDIEEVNKEKHSTEDESSDSSEKEGHSGDEAIG